MKKLIFGAVALGIITIPMLTGECSAGKSWEDSLAEAQARCEKDKTVPPHTIVTIGGCQYIKFHAGRAKGGSITGLTHKGDCNNPIHKGMKK